MTLTWLGLLHLNREELDAALEAETSAHAIFHTPDTVMRHASILHVLRRQEEAVLLLEDEKTNWPNLRPAYFTEVTMPRRCRYANNPSKLLSIYADLANAF
ncbi:hypothetical protein [uncultured Roseobacter sp.]|uniref:hypothetical protein n=1 Tax=uncultured Roseobacter sp. TaxID=114847 RepID=UPI00263076A8|nr:hypothetical protein [uncultured Roseobacter sp.]